MRPVDYLHQIKAIITSCEDLSAQIEEIVSVLADTKSYNRKIFIFGNGGSASTTSHFVNGLFKACELKAFSLVDNIALITAYANDEGYDSIFKAQLERVLSKNDVVVAFSYSGASPNILAGLSYTKARSACTIAFVGPDDTRIKPLTDICIRIPFGTIEQVEDAHLMLTHLITTLLKERCE